MKFNLNSTLGKNSVAKWVILCSLAADTSYIHQIFRERLIPTGNNRCTLEEKAEMQNQLNNETLICS